ncbi:MAG: hypothetical protein DMF87_04360, partial [Acidobacteria bacterium]
NRVTWVLSGDEHVAEYRPPSNAVPIETGRKMEESSSRARFRQPSACRGSIHLRALELFDQPCMVSGWQADSHFEDYWLLDWAHQESGVAPGFAQRRQSYATNFDRRDIQRV